MKKKKKIKRNIWYYEICLKWKRYSEFHNLFKDLLNDEKNFFQYFRMSYGKFNEFTPSREGFAEIE